MQEELQKIPLGIDNFRQIKEDGYLFVDKTAKIIDLVKFGTRYYLSRPRRFGKTMLLSMLGELFTNGDENFRGTAVYGRWPISYRCQVIRLSFYVRVSSAEEFSRYLCRNLCTALSKAGFNGAAYLDITDLDKLLALISLELNKAEGRVVLLVDENDYPLSSNLYNKEVFAAINLILAKFYGFVRYNSSIFRFILVTGIVRFRDSSLFTGQDFADISMDPDYADLLGYTEQEIRTFFGPYLKAAATRLQVTVDELMQQIKIWYDGFCFDYDAKLRLYAPWSINSFFSPVTREKQPVFSYYWMNSSNVNSAMRQLFGRSAYLSPEEIEAGGVTLSYHSLSDPVKQEEVSLKALLVQSGYLTIKSADLYKINYADRMFSCGFTNKEVKRAYNSIFLQYALNKDEEQLGSFGRTAMKAVNSGDYRKIINLFNEILSSISFQVQTVLNENLYREIIRLCLLAVGIDAKAETIGNKGCSDLEISCADKVYVFELKRARRGTDTETDKLLTQALYQLKAKNYGINLQNSGKEVLRIAAVISDSSRVIERFELAS